MRVMVVVVPRNMTCGANKIQDYPVSEPLATTSEKSAVSPPPPPPTPHLICTADLATLSLPRTRRRSGPMDLDSRLTDADVGSTPQIVVHQFGLETLPSSPFIDPAAIAQIRFGSPSSPSSPFPRFPPPPPPTCPFPFIGIFNTVNDRAGEIRTLGNVYLPPISPFSRLL